MVLGSMERNRGWACSLSFLICISYVHELPERIVSDWDSLFTATLWEHLHILMGTELQMSTSYHPQTDRATERANHTITQMLHIAVLADQKDWVLKLPGIEFSFNSAWSDTTGYAPFFLNYGSVPWPMIWDVEREKSLECDLLLDE